MDVCPVTYIMLPFRVAIIFFILHIFFFLVEYNNGRLPLNTHTRIHRYSGFTMLWMLRTNFVAIKSPLKGFTIKDYIDVEKISSDA
jgi:hypothetical protein